MPTAPGGRDHVVVASTLFGPSLPVLLMKEQDQPNKASLSKSDPLLLAKPRPHRPPSAMARLSDHVGMVVDPPPSAGVVPRCRLSPG